VEKKTHTIKHNVICDENKRILYLSKAYHGTTHDKRIADEEALLFPADAQIQLFQDTGFQAYAPAGVEIIQPLKKPRGKQLTEEQKQNNKEISSQRVLVEHAIGGIKILRIIKDKIRIYKERTRNMFMKIACAIHNLKIDDALNLVENKLV
jgi:hypothetical protein